MGGSIDSLAASGGLVFDIYKQSISDAPYP
jgi:hypothetical protein